MPKAVQVTMNRIVTRRPHSERREEVHVVRLFLAPIDHFFRFCLLSICRLDPTSLIACPLNSSLHRYFELCCKPTCFLSIHNMPEESGHALILARYPPRHGSWYLAKARGSLIIYDNPLIDPHCVVYAIPIGSLGPSDTKPYPECLRGNALKSCPNKDALREGDNVLARVRYPYGYESKAKQLGYEMGCVVQRTSDDGVLIEFEHGVREVGHSNICIAALSVERFPSCGGSCIERTILETAQGSP
jgi:hypothetical protein